MSLGCYMNVGWGGHISSFVSHIYQAHSSSIFWQWIVDRVIAAKNLISTFYQRNLVWKLLPLSLEVEGRKIGSLWLKENRVILQKLSEDQLTCWSIMERKPERSGRCRHFGKAQEAVLQSPHGLYHVVGSGIPALAVNILKKKWLVSDSTEINSWTQLIPWVLKCKVTIWVLYKELSVLSVTDVIPTNDYVLQNKNPNTKPSSLTDSLLFSFQNSSREFLQMGGLKLKLIKYLLCLLSLWKQGMPTVKAIWRIQDGNLDVLVQKTFSPFLLLRTIIQESTARSAFPAMCTV